MLEVQRTYARKLVGRSVRVVCADGSVHDGELFGFNDDLLWITGDSDNFVSVEDVIALVPTLSAA